VLRGLDEFREHLGGSLTILMLRSIGAPFDVHEIRRDVMIRSIGVLRDFQHAQRLQQDREERHERHTPTERQGTGG
jgi:3-dehydroquinate synthase